MDGLRESPDQGDPRFTPTETAECVNLAGWVRPRETVRLGADAFAHIPGPFAIEP